MFPQLQHGRMVINNEIAYYEKVHSALDVLQNYLGHRILVRALPWIFNCMLLINYRSLLTVHMIAFPMYCNMFYIRIRNEEISPHVHQALHSVIGSRVALLNYENIYTRILKNSS